jgi:phage terminase small subunit
MNLTADELKALPIELKRLITKYKTTTRDIYGKDAELVETITTVQLQFVSKERAIDMISKHLGFYEIDNEQKSDDIHIYTSNPKHKGLIEDIIEGKK